MQASITIQQTIAKASRRTLWRTLRCCLLLLACGFCVIGCSDPEPPDPAALIPDWRVYYNRDLGIELRYPYTLSLNVEVSADDQLLLELRWVGRGTSVLTLETSAAPGGADLLEGGAAERMVGGERASKSTIEVDGEELQRLKLVRDGRVYEFSGDGDSFEKILDSVRFFAPGMGMVPGTPGAPAS